MRFATPLLLGATLSGCPDLLGAGDEPTKIGELFLTDPGDETSGQDIIDRLVQGIDNARSSIAVALYDLDLPEVSGALADAFDRGVDVRIVGEGDNEDAEGFVDLESAGVPVVYREGSSGIMHHKVIVLDESLVWTGSMNLTDSGARLNDNDALLLHSPELAQAYGTELDQMYAGEFGVWKEPLADAESRHVALMTAPADDTMGALIAAIDGAEVSVQFLVFSFTRADIAEALVRAHDRGVDVVGVVDASQAASRWSQDDWLVEQGVEVHIDGNHENIGFMGGKLHHKLLLVDAGTPEAVAFTGSSNWSSSAAERNDENLLRVADPALVDAYESHFWSRVDQALAAEEP